MSTSAPGSSISHHSSQQQSPILKRLASEQSPPKFPKLTTEEEARPSEGMGDTFVPQAAVDSTSDISSFSAVSSSAPSSAKRHLFTEQPKIGDGSFDEREESSLLGSVTLAASSSVKDPSRFGPFSFGFPSFDFTDFHQLTPFRPNVRSAANNSAAAAAASSSLSLFEHPNPFASSASSSSMTSTNTTPPRPKRSEDSVHPSPGTLAWLQHYDQGNSPVKPFSVVFSPTKQAKIEELVGVQASQPKLSSKDVEKIYKKKEAQNRIIGQYFHIFQATKQEKQLNIVVGLSGSGKSSVVVKPIQDAGEGAILIDSDEIKRLMPEFEGGRGALAVHSASASLAGKCLRKAMEQGDNIIYTTVCTTPGGVKEVIENAKAAGYTVKLHLAHVRPEEAAMRMFKRGLNEHQFLCISPEEILKVGYAPKGNFEFLKELPQVDQYSIWDTAVPGGKIRRQVSKSSSDVSSSESSSSSSDALSAAPR